MIVCALVASLASLSFVWLVADGADTPLPGSPITEVVVFPNHAEITREIVVDAVLGENRVDFTNLIPILHTHTLRASTSGDARIIGTELRTVYLKESLSEEIKTLDRDILELTDTLAMEQRAEARRLEEAAFYTSIKGKLSHDMTREFAESRVSVADWTQVITFVNEGLAGCDEDLSALGVRMRDLTKQLTQLRNQRKDYAERQPREMKEVTVTFDAARAGTTHVQIHYIVDAVHWKPSYDVHLDRDQGQVQITGYGQVLQWTGEPWSDVRLTLAMSRPDFELTVPELTPMVASLDSQEMALLAKDISFLSSSAQGQVEKWSEGRFQRKQERETFRRNLERLSRYTAKNLAQYGLSHAIIEGALTRLVDRFAAVRYELSRPESIGFDSSPRKAVTFSATVPAQLEYVATPALGSSVMLQGVITNTTGHPILAGSSSLFVDGSYVGASAVPGAAENEGLSFGFGPDDALVVDRRLVSRDVKGPEAFRQSRVITYRYAITVENYNDRVVAVKVIDQIPVSKTADIQVTFLQSTTEPAHDLESGGLLWTLDVDPGAQSTIEYAFSVECPVDRDVYWK